MKKSILAPTFRQLTRYLTPETSLSIFLKRENKTFQIEENEYLINLRINWEPCRKVNNTLPYRCKNESKGKNIKKNLN